MMRHDGRLEIQLPAGLREGGDQGEPLDHRVEDQCGEADLRGDALAREPLAAQDSRAQAARAGFQCPGQHESRGHPEQREQALRGEHLRQQMEGDDARGSGEREGARPLEHRRVLSRHQRDGSAEDGGRPGEQGGPDHPWHLSQTPRSSSTCPCTR